MSSFDVDMTIEGIQELQAANERMIAALKPAGVLGEAVRYGTTEGHRYAVAITHVDTGALRGSHRMLIEGSGDRGRVFIDPGTRNPRTGQRPADYGVEEHERGGSHAFYARTESEAGDRIGRQMLEIVRRGL